MSSTIIHCKLLFFDKKKKKVATQVFQTFFCKQTEMYLNLDLHYSLLERHQHVLPCSHIFLLVVNMYHNFIANWQIKLKKKRAMVSELNKE